MPAGSHENIDFHISIWKAINGKTYADLAEKLGITSVSLRSKRNGETDFTWREIIAMCEIFNVSPNVLAGWEEG